MFHLICYAALVRAQWLTYINAPQVVCPLDGYVLISKHRPNEVIVRPVDENMEDYELVISHIEPVEFITDIEEDEEDYGVEMEAGMIIGMLVTDCITFCHTYVYVDITYKKHDRTFRGGLYEHDNGLVFCYKRCEFLIHPC